MKKSLLLLLLLALFAPLAMKGQTTNQLLSENFDSMSSISTSYSGTDWYAYNAGSGNNWTLNTSSSYANSGSKSAQVQYNSSNAANCYLVSKPFTVSANMDQLSVSLYERVRSTSYAETFDVFFVKASDVTTDAGVASATKYTAVASASYTNTTYAQKTGAVTNSALAGQSVRVVVHCTSAADKYYLYIDDIIVTETVTSCHTPTITGVTPTTHGGTIAVSNTNASNFNVQYRKASFSYDFESAEPWTYTDFSPCTTYDGDGGETYGFQNVSFTNSGYTGACIAFQNGVSDNMTSHGGNAFGTMFNSAEGQSNDWFILPELTIENGDVFSFWIREITTQYGDETINVGVCGSTDGTFSSYLAQNLAISSTDWTEKSYDLSSYAGQTIKLAINCVSNDIFGVMIDDIFVGDPNVVWTTAPNVATPITLANLDPATDYDVQVQAVCGGSDGESNWSNIYTFTTLESVCDVPNGLTSSTISNTSATLSWTKGGTETAWVLEYGTASDFTGATQVTSGFSTSGTTVSKSLSLSAGTTYYARVKADCGQGDESEWSDTYIFTTHSVPTVATGSATSVIQTAFTMGGTLDNAGGVAATRGIWYSTNNPNNNPTSSNGTMVAAGAASTETGAYTVDLTNLSAGTTYYCCAYATNTYGTVFGNVVTVTTPNIGAPVVNTNSTYTADDTSITCGGNVLSDGGVTITERGICYMQGTSGDPTTSNTCVTASGTTGEFTVTLRNLTAGTSYRCRAYATNSNGTSYGDTYTFSTGSMPTVVTGQATSVSSINITIGGILTSTGGASTTYGICYSHTATTPTISDSRVEAGTTVEDDTYFDVTLLSLTPGYIYHCRAYATNAFGTTYGDVVVVVTNATAGTPVTETATVYVEADTFEEGKYLILHGNSVGSQYAMNNNNGSSINRTSVTVQNGTITPVEGDPTTANYVETLTTTCVWGVGETSSGTLVIYNSYNSNDYYLSFTNSSSTYGYPLSLSTSGGLTWIYSNNVLGYSGGGFDVYYTNNTYYLNSNNSTPLYLFKGTDVITDTYYSIEVSATTGGTVSQTNSNGHYNLGETCTIIATPSSNYTFAYWSDNGRVVSSNATYSFQVDDNRTLVAHFNEITLCPKPTHFDVDNVGGHDAELSWKNTGAETYEVRYGEYTIEPLWLQYDNDDFESGYGGSTETEKTWGVLYTSSMLNGNNTITKFAMQEYPTWQTASTYTVKFYTGGTTSPGTLIGTETVTMTGSTTMHEVTLSTPIAIDPTQNLWITVTTTGTYVMCCCPDNNNPNNTWHLNSSSGSWEQMDITAGWMIRGYVEYDSSVAPATIVPPYVVSASPSSITWTTKEPTTDNPYELTGLESGTRYVTQVRGNCGGGDGDSPWSDMVVFTTLPTYNVTLNTDGGTINSGNITEYTYTVGATLPTDVTKTGYAFAGWYDNSSLTGTAVTSISTTDTGDKEFWASYVIAYDITLTANPTEGGTLTGAGSYAVGTEVTVTATPNENYSFVNWTEGNSVASTNVSYTFTVSADRDLVANFVRMYEITATANPTEGGSATVSGTGPYAEGTSVTLTATANTGYTFINWTLNNVQVSDEATYTFDADADGEYVANFAQLLTVTAMVNPENSGTVTGDGTYAEGTEITLTATPNAGYSFDNWTLDGDVVSTSATYTFNLSDETEGTYVANFQLNSYAVSTSVSPANSGTVSGAGPYNHGATATLTATPATGYHFVNWSDGNTENPRTVSVTGAASYTANFAINSHMLTITYVTPEGVTAPAQYSQSYEYGAAYSVNSPAVEGYSPDVATVSGNMVDNDVNVTVTYTANIYTITATADPAEGGNIIGAGESDYGTEITLTATANDGYHFVNWTEDGVEVSTESSYSFTVTGDATYVAHFELTLEDITLEIVPFTSTYAGWYLIASPLAEETAATDVVNMTSNQYDLYYFDHAQELEWVNYKPGDNSVNPGFPLVSGKGYLYANSGNGNEETVTLTFRGVPYAGNGEVELTYVDGHPLSGWNLIGNSWHNTTATIATSGERYFMRMNDDHDEIVVTENPNIAPMEGIFVYTTEANEILKLEQGRKASATDERLVLNLSRGEGNVIDRVIVSFSEDGTLPKLMLDEEHHTKVYVPQEEKEYAVVNGTDANIIPVNFKASELGMFKFSVRVDNTNISYLHLIDKLTGEDIDLLIDDTYEFVGTTTEREDRFMLRLDYNSSSSEGDIFAYQNGTDIVVCGEGTLRVYDMMGRFLESHEINGVQTIEAMPVGVYVLKLYGEHIKTQKIVLN